MILEFYQNIGKLFYAIAAADKKVHPTELSKLKGLVKEKWLDVDLTENDESKDAAKHIEIVFDRLKNKALDAETCFEDFLTFKKNHPSLFTADVKMLIMKTANGIATSFSGLNKSELIMLAKLDIELKN
ncbi:hypothetical protein EV196_105252 [Mariniflexile fucanivorans]|uniref:Tellurite resistance protein TerB n=1 Tax=Mariniflexile fucanivorans TaxID=264023 RepID=A0A4R1RI09_9FLAO|nr:hypothetical protein [Mariniflexile fucanivorans]TCL65589.1 hypothetical protein EV196_105252 [Mariniflexile fucanivorans]